MQRAQWTRALALRAGGSVRALFAAAPGGIGWASPAAAARLPSGLQVRRRACAAQRRRVRCRAPRFAQPPRRLLSGARPCDRRARGSPCQVHRHARRLVSVRPTSAPWAARSLSTEAGGEADAAAGDGGAKKAEEPPEEAAADAGKKARFSRGSARRDDRPNEDYNPPPIQAVLSSETKSLMYDLHAKDPVANSETVLAARFGISDLRVRAILMLQKRYHELQNAGNLPAAGVEMEQFVERTSGTVKTGFNSPFYQVHAVGNRPRPVPEQEHASSSSPARPRPSLSFAPPAPPSLSRSPSPCSPPPSSLPPTLHHPLSVSHGLTGCCMAHSLLSYARCAGRPRRV